MYHMIQVVKFACDVDNMFYSNINTISMSWELHCFVLFLPYLKMKPITFRRSHKKKKTFTDISGWQSCVSSLDVLYEILLYTRRYLHPVLAVKSRFNISPTSAVTVNNRTNPLTYRANSRVYYWNVSLHQNVSRQA